jgi:uncharacterized membrane protein YraQ (UPF0718 family)
MFNLLRETVLYVLGTLAHNAPYLAAGIFVAAAIKVYLDPERLRQWLLARSRVSIPASVLFGAFTPFCACGTMAVVISFLATALPWGPIMAFLVSSPLMSPDIFILYAGILGVNFAVALTLASVLLGLAGGYLANYLERRTHFLDNQIRFAAPAPRVRRVEAASPSPTCGCSSAAPPAESDKCACAAPAADSSSGCGRDCAGGAAPRPEAAVSGRASGVQPAGGRLRAMLREAYDVGIKKVLPLFSLFAAIGFFVNRLVPAAAITALFSGSHWYAVPLAAVIGLPLYVTGASALPLLQVLLSAGASHGAVLAFLITGPATSVGAVAGIATIMQRRAIALYVAIILLGGIIAGYGYDLVLRLL